MYARMHLCIHVCMYIHSNAYYAYPLRYPPLHGFESQPGHVTELPVTLGKVVVFIGYSGFLHLLQLASHKLSTIGINVTKKEIPNMYVWMYVCMHICMHVYM